MCLHILSVTTLIKRTRIASTAEIGQDVIFTQSTRGLIERAVVGFDCAFQHFGFIQVGEAALPSSLFLFQTSFRNACCIYLIYQSLDILKQSVQYTESNPGNQLCNHNDQKVYLCPWSQLPIVLTILHTLTPQHLTN